MYKQLRKGKYSPHTVHQVTYSNNKENGSKRTCTVLSPVHLYNLQPDANLSGVQIWPCERCFKNLQFVPTIEAVQIYLHPCANLHSGANCAHERNPYNFYIF